MFVSLEYYTGVGDCIICITYNLQYFMILFRNMVVYKAVFLLKLC